MHTGAGQARAEIGIDQWDVIQLLVENQFRYITNAHNAVQIGNGSKWAFLLDKAAQTIKMQGIITNLLHL
ncbi:MAG: hypothetical protein COA52_16670 [Hyphomicrobiales bacterium]|nr:MAG: hypothetical protein COA52_16670 [Hyphomicrobiales bacterium]